MPNPKLFRYTASRHLAVSNIYFITNKFKFRTKLNTPQQKLPKGYIKYDKCRIKKKKYRYETKYEFGFHFFEDTYMSRIQFLQYSHQIRLYAILKRYMKRAIDRQ